MANVTDTTRRLPASTLGPTARHPHFRFQDAPAPICPAESLNERDRDGMFTDQFVPLMPYTHQAIYDRTQEPQDVPTVELENDHLIVSVLPGWGGRITRCFDKGGNRELLFENPVLQPANLAIRNAWFSGGIEWNGPLYGHSLLTCSPVYVGRITGPFGPGVRIWEFDRSLETTWQVDLHLDDDSPRLWIRVTVINPNPHAVDYYWWTNIAVPENDRTRVLAPSSGEAVFHDVEQNVLRSSFPHRVDAGEPFDGSYSANYPRADSVFFDLHGCRRPWLAGAEADGRGLLHTSGELLVGRKFFVWGRNPGGRRWTDFLAQPGKGSYIELQAGFEADTTADQAAGRRRTVHLDRVHPAPVPGAGGGPRRIRSRADRDRGLPGRPVARGGVCRGRVTVVGQRGPAARGHSSPGFVLGRVVRDPDREPPVAGSGLRRRPQRRGGPVGRGVAG